MAPTHDLGSCEDGTGLPNGGSRRGEPTPAVMTAPPSPTPPSGPRLWWRVWFTAKRLRWRGVPRVVALNLGASAVFSPYGYRHAMHPRPGNGVGRFPSPGCIAGAFSGYLKNQGGVSKFHRKSGAQQRLWALVGACSSSCSSSLPELLSPESSLDDEHSTRLWLRLSAALRSSV